jgi:hypothetical protein
VSTEKLTREDVAKLEIGHTDIERPVALFLVAIFLAAVFGVPLIQHVIEFTRKGQERKSVCSAFAGVGPSMRKAWKDAPSPMRKVLDPNIELLGRIHDFEDQLDETCFLTTLSRQPMQSLMCRLGVGNEKAVLGRDGWLFYEPSLRHVVGRPFFDDRQLLKRSRSVGEWNEKLEPNPIEAITRFRDRLQDIRIDLVVVPVPAKPSIHPEYLSSRVQDLDTAHHNPSYWDLIQRLEDSGVHYVDPTGVLMEEKKRSGTAYLKTDTHWTPNAMREVAREISELLLAEGLLADPTPSQDYNRRKLTVTNQGDIAAMLNLADTEYFYPKETVVIEQIVDDEERAWEVRRDSQILLLGDSFANIYSDSDMAWGSSAGLAEQLSCELQRPVDAMIQNDSGAFATRAKLATELAKGRNRLKDKSVVVWVFAARELTVGNWKIIDPILGEVRAVRAKPEIVTGWREVACKVEDVSNRPRKDVPYKNFIMKLFVTDMVDADGNKVDEGDGVIRVFGMRDRKILPVAQVQKGAKLSLKIRLWEDVETKYRRIKVGALSDEMLELEKELYWSEKGGTK